MIRKELRYYPSLMIFDGDRLFLGEYSFVFMFFICMESFSNQHLVDSRFFILICWSDHLFLVGWNDLSGLYLAMDIRLFFCFFITFRFLYEWLNHRYSMIFIDNSYKLVRYFFESITQNQCSWGGIRFLASDWILPSSFFRAFLRSIHRPLMFSKLDNTFTFYKMGIFLWWFLGGEARGSGGFLVCHRHARFRNVGMRWGMGDECSLVESLRITII